MVVERVFNDNSKISLKDILDSLILECIDTYIQNYYNADKVNFTTSHVQEGGEVSA